MSDIFKGGNRAFRQIGWQGGSGTFYSMAVDPSRHETGSFSPIYIEVGTFKRDPETGEDYLDD